MTVFSVQPDAAAGVDTFLYRASVNSNFGTNVNLAVGQTGTGDTVDYRSLIKFDLSSIPSSAIVSAASISLYYHTGTNGVSNAVRFYRQLKAWVEAQATWNIYSTGNNWTTAGGFDASDCEQSDIGSVTISDQTYEFKTIALTASKVQEWISGAVANNGLLIKADDESTSNSNKYFYSSDYAVDTAKRPIFSVTYTVATGGTNPLFANIFNSEILQSRIVR